MVRFRRLGLVFGPMKHGGGVGQDGRGGGEVLRQDVAVAIRIVLEEGVREADDPVRYLRSAMEEIRQLVILAEGGRSGGGAEGTAIRSILMDEVETAIQEMIRHLHH